MTTTLYYAIVGLIVLMIGMACSFAWFIRVDASDRRKHYQITITVSPDGILCTHRSGMTEAGKEAIVVVPYANAPIANINIQLSDGSATVTDMRKDREAILDRHWKS